MLRTVKNAGKVRILWGLCPGLNISKIEFKAGKGMA